MIPCAYGMGFFNMDTNLINILFTAHREWVRLVCSFGVDMYAEDIVQETYIKLMQGGGIKKAVVNGEINRAFMYISLRNHVVSYHRSKGKIQKVELDERMEYEEGNIERHIAISIVDQKIQAEINKWHWYDRDMFMHYMSSGRSQREIADRSKISLSSISNTIVNCKNKLREKVGEDMEDIFNMEYNRVKDE